MFGNWKWKPPEDWGVIKTVELHTGGEPLRVFTDGLPEIQGNTILEKRRYFRDNYDYIRTGTLLEPRGHADMYGAVLTEPTSQDADFGTFFLHNEGYSTMCGHAIIALTKLVLDTNLIKKEGENPVLKIDAPPGQIIAVGHRKEGIVESVSFYNVPSFVLMQDQIIEVRGIGRINIDIAFGGAFYAFCDAIELGLDLDKNDYSKLIEYGKKIKQTVMDNFKVQHPFEEDLGFLYGTIFIGNSYDYRNHSRNVCVFANGELDRSATGSGVSARAAIHFMKNELKPGEKITVESILGTTMDVEIMELTQYGPYQAVIPKVTGSASIIGQSNYYFDPDDPFKEGFIFR
jgi:proline racemase